MIEKMKNWFEAQSWGVRGVLITLFVLVAIIIIFAAISSATMWFVMRTIMNAIN